MHISHHLFILLLIRSPGPCTSTGNSNHFGRPDILCACAPSCCQWRDYRPWWRHHCARIHCQSYVEGTEPRSSMTVWGAIKYTWHIRWCATYPPQVAGMTLTRTGQAGLSWISISLSQSSLSLPRYRSTSTGRDQFGLYILWRKRKGR